MTARRITDYPRNLPVDGRSGEERRVTIDRLPIRTDGADLPLVSIITVVYNNVRHIDRAMQSVFAQTYRNIEYILIDGGSSDGTVDVIRRHAERLSYWHSARDGGISDAFNAGVALARGSFVGLVNSDDWMSPDQVECGVEALKRTQASFVFGDLIYHQSANAEPVYSIKGDPRYADKLWHRMPQLTHPTALVRREVYEHLGLFDPAWEIGMDYDWLLRLHHAHVHGVHCPAIVGHMSLGGVSDARWRKCLDEHRRIAQHHGSPAVVLVPLYWFRKQKIRARRLIEAILPQSVTLWMRRLLNRSLGRVANG